MYKFAPKVRVIDIQALVRMMAWCRPGDKSLSEPVMINLLTHISVTRPQWINLRRIWMDALVMLYGIRYILVNIGSCNGMVLKQAPNHYLNQCWLIDYRILRNKLLWNLNQNRPIFNEGNTFWNVCVLCVNNVYMIHVITPPLSLQRWHFGIRLKWIHRSSIGWKRKYCDEVAGSQRRQSLGVFWICGESQYWNFRWVFWLTIESL